MLQKVVVLAMPGLAPFEFGVLCEVFGLDRSAMGGPRFDFHIATETPGTVTTNMGFDLVISEDLSVAADADLVAVAARSIGPVEEAYLEVVRAAAARGAWVLSVCSGAFVLAEAGILDGRRATTHWMYADRLAAEYPRIEVDPEVLYIDDDRVVTGAGTAAGIDAALHIVREEHGVTATNVIARRMVVPAHREGGQAQFIPTPIVACRDDSLARVADWMVEHLEQELPIERLAREALMSTRTFARRFRAEFGTTPAAWLNAQRLLRARQLLEESDESLERIAQLAGFGTAAVMRHHFLKTLQTTPTGYRTAFGARESA
ncbi:MAG: helix-turn-helix domain-containing protein [Actinomycetales bacterium]|nr:helix-turn-helix domain-containing protein [Actinomycetales bacterium]